MKIYLWMVRIIFMLIGVKGKTLLTNQQRKRIALVMKPCDSLQCFLFVNIKKNSYHIVNEMMSLCSNSNQF